jgi:hypothetical protein
MDLSLITAGIRCGCCLSADNVAAAWLFFAVLTWVHVWANIRALRCLVLSSVNEPRLRLLLQHYQDKVRLSKLVVFAQRRGVCTCLRSDCLYASQQQTAVMADCQG